ncbi:soluble lytic murein transglycosylase [Desulforamulus aeronauticus DSM 10349]|uniref:Soluble lytic murein transglycosylase n=1 Tax=Desulforamulus aeronauticus DSM 10349 TaxID=1121421 RepID=A0A1M6P1W9_9FIRM|nr:lytic transglycosylase domain-containing protein [Desulforamulus aeronauticus]SHK01908.1 soluble lytic murein transglycosylase [Desulforamulus aeronauticus DSM 10349]
MFLRRKKKPRLKRKLLLVLLLLILWLNHRAIAEMVYPLHHQEVIYHYSEVKNLDPLLVAAIIKTESNFQANATSPKGARGLMQLMPETASWVAEQTGNGPLNTEALYNPETNIQLGTWYLADLLELFEGDVVLATAAYNAGRGNVKKWLDQQHWTGQRKTIDQIPFVETRQYIRRVLWNYKVYYYLYGEGQARRYDID